MSERKLIPPYTLYPQQEQYSLKITEAVSRGKGEVLIMEAGTGFGKTIANLYGVLSATKSQIVYLSKTHQQNQQIVAELLKMNDVNKEFACQAIQLASRAQLCHVKDVIEAPYSRLAIELCQHHRNMRKDSKKILYENCTSILKHKDHSHRPVSIPLVTNLEDLRKLAREHDGCAYLTARDLMPNMDVIIGHYYYFFSESVREATGLADEEVVLVLDEGHNLENICCELMSRHLDIQALTRAQEELNYFHHPKLTGYLTKIAVCIKGLQKFLKDQTTIPLATETFLEELHANGIDSSFIEDFQFEYSVIREQLLKKLSQVNTREILSTNLDRVINFFEVSHLSPKDYGIVIEKRVKTKGFDIAVGLECLNPALLFTKVRQHCRAVVICSGTLSPLSLTAELLGVPQAELHAWGSIIDPKNVQVLVIPESPQNIQLTTSYQQRQNHEVFLAYRETIQTIVPQIPGGVLIFFPSYSLLDQVALPARIGTTKVFFESHSARENEMVLEDYKAQINSTKHAVLVGVIGGKLAEGADYPGDYARAVMVCGIPFSPVNDPTVVLKKAFYERMRANLGKEWYLADAIRKTAQALGRGWRGRDDYALGILLDNRFSYTSNTKLLPEWMRNRLVVAKTWGTADSTIKNFFNAHEKV